MSLLNFLFKDRQSKGAELSDEPVQESGPSSRFPSDSSAAAESGSAHTPDPLHPPPGEAAMTLDQIRDAISELGYTPRQRNVHYELVEPEQEDFAVEANRKHLQQMSQDESLHQIA